MKQLNYIGVSSRLILIRNVNYIIEQQKLETRASFERQLTNTLSHELLTPLNCIINLSENLKDEGEYVIEKLVKKYNKKQSDRNGKKLQNARETSSHNELVWSSGKILEYTIKSIISRQQYNEENRVIPR